MTLPHGQVKTPVFMPVGTKGAIKGITFQEMKDMGCEMLLGNTYHLGNTPGPETLSSFNGLHEFIGWDRCILTDSGGFQMVSLLKLAEITEQGVEFESPVDSSRMLLSPEESIRIQNIIGSDIMMALDDVCNPLSPPERVEEACSRTSRWIDRCLSAHATDNQNLFAIIQGGVDSRLRDCSLEQLIEKDLPGYAIGGLCGGEHKEDFVRVVSQCTARLPKDKPVYVMGIGYPVDLLVCTCLGADMFDCVFATRTARFGQVFTRGGLLKLKTGEMKNDFGPIDRECLCHTCQRYSRAYLSTIAGKEEVACNLLSVHNVAFLFKLMEQLRDAIIEGTLPVFVGKFLNDWFSGRERVPQWVVEALELGNITLS